MSINTLKHVSIGVWGCLSCIGDQKDITTSLMTMKTTTESSKNQKLSREVREERVLAI